MNNQNAKESLDTIIKKARVHLYKPIQIAEILYRDSEGGQEDGSAQWGATEQCRGIASAKEVRYVRTT